MNNLNNLDSTNPTIRWGIVGAGRIAKTFANDIQLAEHATLVAVASRNLDSASFCKRMFGRNRLWILC